MKRLILGLFTVTAFLFGGIIAKAQTFYPAHDTSRLTYYGSFGVEVHNDITVPGLSNLSITWRVVAENFSSDPTWIANQNTINICDNYQCITNNNQQLLNGTQQGPSTYYADSTDIFKASFMLPNANPGTHYVSIELKDAANNFDTTITFVVSKWATGVTTVSKSYEDVTIYPNPAVDDLNVLFDADRGIRNIAVYNVIGKAMVVYKVAGNNAKMDISKLPNGVYFLRLSDSKGQVVSTRRFTKQ